MTAGIEVFVLGRDFLEAWYILSNSWADPIVLEQTLDFSSEGQNPPRVFVVQFAWAEALMRKNVKDEWEFYVPFWKPNWMTLFDSNLVYFIIDFGHLVEKQGSISIENKVLHLKPIRITQIYHWREGLLFLNLFFGW